MRSSRPSNLAELDVLDEVLAEHQAERAHLAQQYADRVARASYEAKLTQPAVRGSRS